MNERLSYSLRIATIALVIAYLGSIQQESECTDGVKVSGKYAVCNQEDGVHILSNQADIVLGKDVACDASDVFIWKERITAYKDANPFLQVTTINPLTREQERAMYYVSFISRNKC